MELTKNAAIAVVGSQVKMFLSLVIGIILARSLGPVGMGKVQLIVTLATVVATLGTLGIGRANVYVLNRLKVEPTIIVGNTLVAAAVLVPLVVLLILTALIFGAGYFGRYSAFTIGVVSVTSALMLVQALLRPMLLAQMKVLAHSSSQVVIQATRFVVLLALLLTDSISVEVAIWSLAIAQFAGLLFVVHPLRALVRSAAVVRQRLVKTARYGIPIHATSLLLFFDQQIAFFMFAFMTPGDFFEIGIYSRALALCGIIRSLLGVLFDLLYSHWANIDIGASVQQAEKSARILSFVGAAITLPLIVFSQQVVSLLYGSEFLLSSVPLRILAIQQLFWIFSKVMEALFVANGQAKFSLQGLAMSLSVNIFGMVLLIPSFGAIGAALAVMSAQAVYLIVNIIKAGSLGLNFANCIVMKRRDFEFVALKLKGLIKDFKQ